MKRLVALALCLAFTPDFVGQLLLGSESNLIWVAGGATTNDWLPLTVTE